MNSAATFLPRLWLRSERRISRSASTSREHSSAKPARVRRSSVDADAVLTRTIEARALHTRWA
jgi:hypothetical protein